MPGNANGLENDGAYLVKEGWTAAPNKKDLQNLINAANISSQASWWAKLATVTDRSQLIRMWATENFVGHWDGYSGPIINNHYWRSSVSGKFSMIPWGTDQTFGENRQTSTPNDDYFFPMDRAAVGFPWVWQAFKKETMNRGLLFRKCLAYKPCKTEYLLQLKAVSAKATSIRLTTLMKNASTLIAPYSNDATKQEQARTQAWVVKQQAKVAALLKLNKIK
jgi:hypothetical protein